MKLGFLCFVTGAGLSIVAAQESDVERIRGGAGVDQRILRSQTPKNLLRAHLGVTGGTGPSCPLLSDDPSVPLSLHRGTYEIGFNLGDLHVVSEIAFINRGTSGKIDTLLSANGRDWETAFSGHLLPDSRKMRFRFIPTEARFVKLAFDIDGPGEIYCVGLFGLTLAADYEVVVEETTGQNLETVRPSLTITPTETIAPWVSSQKDAAENASAALEMIDENAFTEFEFSVGDPNPTVVLDLAGQKDLRRVKILCKEAKGTIRLNFFADREELEIEAARTDRSAGKPGEDRIVDVAGKNPIGITGKNPLEHEAGNPIRAGVGKNVIEEPLPEDLSGVAVLLGDDSVELMDGEGKGRFSFEGLKKMARFVALTWLPFGATDGGFAINEIAVFASGDNQIVRPRTTIPFGSVLQSSPESGTPGSNQLQATQAVGPEPNQDSPPVGGGGSGDSGVDLELEPTSF